ncbi:ABC transporter I family member 10, chloroplastic isoform X3 [Ananas comosus]|uniref:ABC transporter I family member 10, chloroplastic isoform X3 n=1 Tax=Ananas comosus TaxID=4615 RepID=A0A6P5FDQ6_ANACO|nr:ABC transporter I family member 10, chloroplastic isoform X3 [Ananas comosus]
MLFSLFRSFPSHPRPQITTNLKPPRSRRRLLLLRRRRRRRNRGARRELRREREAREGARPHPQGLLAPRPSRRALDASRPQWLRQVHPSQGLLEPTEGTVLVNRPCSFVFQNPDHQVVMPTVEADVAFGLGKFKLSLDEVKARVSKALDAVGMLDYSQRPIQTLSGGQKQRVAIAGALAEACKVLLLDELTTFLDEYDQIGVIKAVKNSVAGSGEVAALWVTHRLEELKYADGAIYMEEGQIVIHGDVASISKFLKEKQARYRDFLNL